MYKIAILGCENSHADAFLSLLAEGRYPDITPIGVYSNEEEPPRILNEKYGVPILSSPEEAVGRVDGVMITARHGGLHSVYAAPYLDAGIPMFIDKPITAEEKDGLRFMAQCKKRGVRLCGGSTCANLRETVALARAVKTGEMGALLGGHIVCPIQRNSPYGGFTFYAEHLVDVMLRVFGKGVRRVRVEKSPDAWNVLADYGDYAVAGTWGEGISYYSVSLLGKKGIRTETLTFSRESFAHEMDDMAALLRGGAMQKSYEDFLLPVFVIGAALHASESGEWEEVRQIHLPEVP